MYVLPSTDISTLRYATPRADSKREYSFKIKGKTDDVHLSAVHRQPNFGLTNLL